MLIKTWKHFVETHLILLLTHYVNEASVDNDIFFSPFYSVSMKLVVVGLGIITGIHLMNVQSAILLELWNLLLVEINAVIEVNCCAFSIVENKIKAKMKKKLQKKKSVL